ncbi:hypothetical protein AB0F11_30330 [Streptomyces sp. NPDC032472]|uniref:hypothetical protein n=1 Tax=Streptomyces sp. NPDC032472 TaxID=3155018 RepID=UPI003401FB4B
MTSFLSRRLLLKHAAATAGIGALVASGTTAPAAVASARRSSGAGALPEIGQTLRFTASGLGATLVVNLPPPLPTLNFTGSRTVKVMAGGADFVRLHS